MRTYPLLSGLLALGLLASCAQYEDYPSHDQYPSTRIAQGLEDIRTALRSSAEGWDLVLIPDGGNFGGINLSMRFTSASEVVMSSEAYQKGGTIPSVVTNPQSDLEAVTKTEFGSTYHLSDKGGIQLTFDTFNVALHSWSNPGWGVPNSYNGDFTFRVDSISRDHNTIYLQGARTKTPMRLTRRTSGDKDQLQRCFAMKQELQGKALAPITLGGKQYELSIFGFARQLSLRSGGKEELLPFHYTPQGIELLRPYVAGSDSLTALHLSADKQSMSTPDGRQKLALYQGEVDLTRRYMQLYFYDGYASEPFLAETRQADQTQALDSYPGSYIFTLHLGMMQRSMPVMGSYLDAGYYFSNWVDYYADFTSVYNEPKQLHMTRLIQQGLSWFYGRRAMDRFYAYIVAQSPYVLTEDPSNSRYQIFTSVANSQVWVKGE